MFDTGVNVANINKLIDVLTKEPDKLIMSNWVERDNDCESPACLVGWCNRLCEDDLGYTPSPNSLGIASRWLGITYGMADLLAYMRVNEDIDYHDVDIKEWFDSLPPEKRRDIAVSFLIHLRDYGKVDWDHALSDVFGDHWIDEVDRCA